MRDDLFTRQAPGPGEFRFDDAVARVFPDMLRRSIPGYQTLLELVGVLAHGVVVPDTNVYDLGCSLGAVSLSVRHALGARSARIVAVDNSQAMVDRCRSVVDADSASVPVEVQLGDVASFPLTNASLIVLNFTLQFIPPDERLALLERAARALVPGGVLVLSEKIRGDREPEERENQRLHDAFRQANGYSQLELGRKRDALERVLVPDGIGEHEARLRAAGLEPRQWFRALSFVSWIASKS